MLQFYFDNYFYFYLVSMTLIAITALKHFGKRYFIAFFLLALADPGVWILWYFDLDRTGMMFFLTLFALIIVLLDIRNKKILISLLLTTPVAVLPLRLLSLGNRHLLMAMLLSSVAILILRDFIKEISARRRYNIWIFMFFVFYSCEALSFIEGTYQIFHFGEAFPGVTYLVSTLIVILFVSTDEETQWLHLYNKNILADGEPGA